MARRVHAAAVPIAATLSAVALPAAVMFAAPGARLGHAADRPASGSLPARPCASRQLALTLPPSVPGDPGAEGGYVSLDLVWRNRGGTCALRGWPKIAVYTAGHSVPTRVTDGYYDELQVLPERAVLLRTGQRAVVTAFLPDHAAGCSRHWALAVAAAGARRPAVLQPAAADRGLCAGGRIQVSPYLPLATLLAAIRNLGRAAGPPAYPAPGGPEPAPCAVPGIRAAVTGLRQGATSVAVTVRLWSARHRCTLATGGWPVVLVRRAGSRGTVAKAMADPAAARRGVAPFVSYPDRYGDRSVLTLTRHPGGALIVLVLGRGRRTRSCARASSVTIFPAPAAIGPGLRLRLPSGVASCGRARTLQYVSGRPAVPPATLAEGALRLADQARGGTARGGAERGGTKMIAAGDGPPGFWYGSDGPMTMACHTGRNGTYLESADPRNAAAGLAPARCPYGTAGAYGGYLGELGRWEIWQECDRARPPWNGSDYAGAQANLTSRGLGAGAAGYWILGGPGRSGNYASLPADTAWGRRQAVRAVADIGGHVLGFPDIFADIELRSGPFDSGWHNAFAAVCATGGTSDVVTPAQSKAVLSGFARYIRYYTPYFPGVYSSGLTPNRNYTWPGIFGSLEITGTAEWAYDSETPSYATFPRGWSIPGTAVSALWFGGPQPPACLRVWQWTGGSAPNATYQGFRADQIWRPLATPQCG